MSDNRKIKVVWICHFYEKSLDDKLPLRKKGSEFAPWVRDLILQFKDRPEVELYIISPIEYLKKRVFRYTEGNIHYTFFNAHIPIYGRHWPGFFKWDYFSNFKQNRKFVSKEVDKISPDIVNLIGAENAYYSSSILDIKDKYPHLVSIQGFIHLNSGTGNQHKKKAQIEKQILSTCNNFAYQINHTANVIKSFNNFTKLHHFFYPVSLPPKGVVNNGKTQYDFVFFARITKDKGIEDLIIALANVKSIKPDVKLAVLGKTSVTYMGFLKQLAIDNGVDKNIEWLGFLPTQAEVHDIVSKSKITVLPTYNDIISGTIIESMFIKTPVIAYGVGGIPDLNNEEEVIKVIEKGNVKMLANKMKELLLNEKKQMQLADKAYQKAIQLFDNKKVYSNMMSIYKKIIKSTKNEN
ncbi:MAG: glycosyltransferase family 4 protein [Flavobacteriaceae bacterium]